MSYSSFVDNKGNKQWVWLALDVATCEIVGVYIGARSGSSGTQVMGILAPGSTASARLYTRTFEQLMEQFYRANDRRAVGKETDKTSYIEHLTIR